MGRAKMGYYNGNDGPVLHKSWVFKRKEVKLKSGFLREKSETEESERLRSYQYVGRTGSVIPTTSLAGAEVSIKEIRSATSFSGHYPPSIHAPFINSPEPLPNEEAILHQGPYTTDYGTYSNDFRRQLLDEVEIRELLIDHVGHRCCWGSRPARTWKIHAVEDCNVYVGTLETFLEEREVVRETEPYHGGNIDGKDKGPELVLWELDLRSQFPALYVPYKETRVKIPRCETVEKCSGCAGRGDIACPTCNADQEPGFYKQNQMSRCPACYGRGLIAHRDGSDTMSAVSSLFYQTILQNGCLLVQTYESYGLSLFYVTTMNDFREPCLISMPQLLYGYSSLKFLGNKPHI